MFRHLFVVALALTASFASISCDRQPEAATTRPGATAKPAGAGQTATSQPDSSQPSVTQRDNAEPKPETHQGGPKQEASPEWLARFVPESGDLVDPQNSPKCSISTVLARDIDAQGKGLKASVNGFINWPKDYQQPKSTPYSENEKDRIVVEGMYYTDFGQGGGLRCIGKFITDRSLNPTIGIWDGKKIGAVHTVIGKLTMFECEFSSDETSPLVFRVTKSGYELVKGKGKVLDLKSGKSYSFSMNAESQAATPSPGQPIVPTAEQPATSVVRVEGMLTTKAGGAPAKAKVYLCHTIAGITVLDKGEGSGLANPSAAFAADGNFSIVVPDSFLRRVPAKMGIKAPESDNNNPDPGFTIIVLMEESGEFQRLADATGKFCWIQLKAGQAPLKVDATKFEDAKDPPAFVVRDMNGRTRSGGTIVFDHSK